MEENQNSFYVLDLIDLLEQKIYRDSNLRVKLMYESVKYDVLKPMGNARWYTRDLANVHDDD